MSVLRSLLESAIADQYQTLILSETGIDHPVRGRGPDGRVYPRRIGDHHAAVAELPLQLPIEPGEGAGKVDLDGKIIEYQGITLIHHKTGRNPYGWNVTFHLINDPPPADEYLPTVKI